MYLAHRVVYSMFQLKVQENDQILPRVRTGEWLFVEAVILVQNTSTNQKNVITGDGSEIASKTLGIKNLFIQHGQLCWKRIHFSSGHFTLNTTFQPSIKQQSDVKYQYT